MWPFRRHGQSGRDSRDDSTDEILSWTERTLAAEGARLRHNARLVGLLDTPTDVSDPTAESGDWRGSVQDPWGSTHAEVGKEPDSDGARAEPGTTIVVVTTQSPEASEGEAHIFTDAQEAKVFVEGLIDNGFDRERIKTIRGGSAHFNLSFHAVVDFD